MHALPFLPPLDMNCFCGVLVHALQLLPDLPGQMLDWHEQPACSRPISCLECSAVTQHVWPAKQRPTSARDTRLLSHRKKIWHVRQYPPQHIGAQWPFHAHDALHRASTALLAIVA